MATLGCLLGWTQCLYLLGTNLSSVTILSNPTALSYGYSWNVGGTRVTPQLNWSLVSC